MPVPRRVAPLPQGAPSSSRERACFAPELNERFSPSTGGQLAFSSWPPKPFRIAESTLFAKSSSPREAKRE